jgi:hypothetical protein
LIQVLPRRASSSSALNPGASMPAVAG